MQSTARVIAASSRPTARATLCVFAMDRADDSARRAQIEVARARIAQLGATRARAGVFHSCAGAFPAVAGIFHACAGIFHDCRFSASTTASWSAGRTWLILLFSRVGWTRLVSSTTKSCFSGSTQIDVTRETGMPEAARRKIPAARRIWRRHVPAQRARICGESRRGSELRDRGAPQHAPMCIDAAVQQHLAECGQVRCRRKHSGVARDPAHDPGIFIMHFASQEAPAEVSVVLGGRDALAQGLRGIKCCRAHAERFKDALARKFVERAARNPCDDFAQKNKSDIGVHALRAGLAHERFCHDAAPPDPGELPAF